jgi:phosphoenolpyruvate synthase/pyruvate phosphate dikinase
MGITLKEVREKIDDLHEFNPMLGHRGCRLGNTYPEISETQARAIIEAAMNLKKERNQGHTGNHDPTYRDPRRDEDAGRNC